MHQVWPDENRRRRCGAGQERAASRVADASVNGDRPERGGRQVAHRRHGHLEHDRARRDEPCGRRANLIGSDLPADRECEDDENRPGQRNDGRHGTAAGDEGESRQEHRKSGRVGRDDGVAGGGRSIAERRQRELAVGPGDPGCCRLWNDGIAVQPQPGLAQISILIGAARDDAAAEQSRQENERRKNPADSIPA